MIALIDLESVISRLKDNTSGFLLVAGAAALADAVTGSYTVPAAFVSPVREIASDNKTATTEVFQRVQPAFSVVILARNLKDPRGEAALQTLKPLRESAMTALLGWTPTNCTAGCEFVSGRMQSFDNAVLWWEDVYRSELYVRSQ